ncbi:amidohydrolase family protein, partial [Chloroflexota bacterium]
MAVSPFEHWSDVLDLVQVPNIYLKVSALPEATHERYPFPKAQEYMRQVYERFGPDRMIWGSNYPVTL